MAQKFLVPGGTGNWNSTTNWSLTSGGVPGAPFPTVLDDVVIDTNSANANLTVNVASACLSFTASNSTGTMTFTSTLTCSGNFTFSSGMSTSGTGILLVNATATITSNGVSLTGTLRFQTTGTVITLADNWVVGGLGIPGTSNLTVNGNTITCSGSFTLTGNGNIFQGTTNIILNGTGSVTNSSTSGTSAIRNNLTINTAGTITISGNFRYDTGVLTYTAGTVVTTGSSFIMAASTTVNANGIVWNEIVIGATLTLTLQSNLSAGEISSASFSLTFAGAYNVTIGNLIQVAGNAVRTFTFVAGQTYTISSIISITGTYTSANHQVFVSSSPGTRYNLILLQGISQDNFFLDVTDADSSAGATGCTYKGVLSNCLNWRQLPTQVGTITYAN